MADDFDRMVEEIQASIIEDARKTFSEKVIQRWINPRQMGEIGDAQAYGKVTGPCGDTVQIFLRINKDLISSSGDISLPSFGTTKGRTPSFSAK